MCSAAESRTMRRRRLLIPLSPSLVADYRSAPEGSEEIQKGKVAGFLFGYMGAGKH
jgi:hypothetical protein